MAQINHTAGRIIDTVQLSVTRASLVECECHDVSVETMPIRRGTLRVSTSLNRLNGVSIGLLLAPIPALNVLHVLHQVPRMPAGARLDPTSEGREPGDSLFCGQS